MSEGGGDTLGPPYAVTGGFQTAEPATPSSTVPDIGSDLHSKSIAASGLPPFSSFTASELASEGLGSRLGPEGFGTETYVGRIDLPWTYYDEGLSGRLLERNDGGLPMLIPQPQYRPWESKPLDALMQDGGGFGAKTYEYTAGPQASKLPSFQSQFQPFPGEQNGETISLTTLTPAPPSPTANNSGLPSFHTLSTVTVNPRGYPLVPAPVQAREIPHIQQQFIDERHIQLFQSPAATLNNAQYHQLGLSPATNPGIIQGNFVTHPQPPTQQTTLLTVVKTEPVAIVTTQLQQTPVNIYHNSNSILEQHESPMTVAIKAEENAASSSPRVVESRKKERRKARSSSIENSAESDGVGSSSVESSGQVAAISSTANFKSSSMMQQHQSMGGNSLATNAATIGQHGDGEECENGNGEKQTKKKRKRCGECIGCQRKDNCGECAPCRNDKSHQICKMRRCEKLTDKKHLLYLQNDFPRTESRRGRGKGTRASYRSKGGRGGGNSNQNQGPPTPQQSTASGGAVTPQPAAHPQPGSIVTLNGGTNDQSPNATIMATTNHSPGSAMPFYSSNIPTGAGSVTDAAAGFPQPVRPDHRFANTVWQQSTAVPTDGTAMAAWPPQSQFIQQLPPTQMDDVRYHAHAAAQYSPATPVTIATYTGYQQAAQQQQSQPATPTQNSFLQSNGPAYQTAQQSAATASPLMNGRNTPRTNAATVNGGGGGTMGDYMDASPRSGEFINGAYNAQENNLVSQPASTPNSRCSSVHAMDTTNNGDAINSSSSSSIPPPVSKTPTGSSSYTMGAVVQTIGAAGQPTNQGNAMPGYLPQQPPQSQLQSLHNSSGYPGQNAQSVNHNRFTGEEMQQQQQRQQEQMTSKARQTPKSWTEQTDAANFRGVDDRANVNNKLKTMIMNKKQNNANANQTQYHQSTVAAGNYRPPSSDGGQQQHQQQPQNGQFCSPTPPPMSPSSSLQLSSQHYQFSQTRTTQHQQQQQAQHELQLQQQIRQAEHLQQMNHQYQQQQQQQQQQFLQQQQQHMQQQLQQQQNMQLHMQNAAAAAADNRTTTTNDKNLISPTRNYATPSLQQQQQTYLENYDKQNERNNFLAVGHHPRSSVTEGGGFWDSSPAANAKTTETTMAERTNETETKAEGRAEPSDAETNDTISTSNGRKPVCVCFPAPSDRSHAAARDLVNSSPTTAGGEPLINCCPQAADAVVAASPPPFEPDVGKPPTTRESKSTNPNTRTNGLDEIHDRDRWVAFVVAVNVHATKQKDSEVDSVSVSYSRVAVLFERVETAPKNANCVVFCRSKTFTFGRTRPKRMGREDSKAKIEWQNAVVADFADADDSSSKYRLIGVS